MFDYDKALSKKAVSLKPSGIRKFFDLLETHKDAISLTIGEPDFPTPWHIRETGIESLRNGMTYYTANSGTENLRVEISNYMKRRFDLQYNHKNEILVTVGGSEAIDISIRAIVEDGDEVIIPEPCFVCYAPIVALSGGVPVIINTKPENDFKLTPEELRAAITPKTKMLVLPYPNNPTGAILTKPELEALAAVLRETNIIILSDEIYAELTYGQRHTSIALIDGMQERTILVGGFSKAFAMTGWRLGFICAPRELVKHIFKIHQYAIMCAPTTSQLAAIEALKNGDADIKMMHDEYNRRRRLIVDGLNSIGLDCFEPLGAFYVFPKIGGFGMTSEEFCQQLLDRKNVAIVPGTAFGQSGEGYARISYAYSLKHIQKALEAMKEFVNDIKK